MALSRGCCRLFVNAFSRTARGILASRVDALSVSAPAAFYAQPSAATAWGCGFENDSGVFREPLRTQGCAFSSGSAPDGADGSPPPVQQVERNASSAKNDGVSSSERLAQLEQQVKELQDIMVEYERHMKEYVLEKVLDIEDEMREVRRSSGVQTVQHQPSIDKADSAADPNRLETKTKVEKPAGASETWRDVRDSNTIDVAVVQITEDQRGSSG